MLVIVAYGVAARRRAAHRPSDTDHGHRLRAARRGRRGVRGAAPPGSADPTARHDPPARRRHARDGRQARRTAARRARSCCGSARAPCTSPSPHAVDLDISATGALYLVALTNFAAALPAAPGSIGTFDAAVVFGANALGGAGAVVTTYLLLLRFILYVPITVVGPRRARRALRRLGADARDDARAEDPGERRLTGHEDLMSTSAAERPASGSAGVAQARTRRRLEHPCTVRAHASGDRRLPRDRGAHPAVPVHAHLRPVGLDHVGPRDRAFRSRDRGRAVVEAAAGAVHRRRSRCSAPTSPRCCGSGSPARGRCSSLVMAFRLGRPAHRHRTDGRGGRRGRHALPAHHLPVRARLHARQLGGDARRAVAVGVRAPPRRPPRPCALPRRRRRPAAAGGVAVPRPLRAVAVVPRARAARARCCSRRWRCRCSGSAPSCGARASRCAPPAARTTRTRAAPPSRTTRGSRWSGGSRSAP